MKLIFKLFFYPDGIVVLHTEQNLLWILTLDVSIFLLFAWKHLGQYNLLSLANTRQPYFIPKYFSGGGV